MKFFFPDSQDQVDPTFDFLSEDRSPHRVRQRQELYAHEALVVAPFDGILVSKTIVDGHRNGSSKYTVAQRHRLYRVGVREFFRLPRTLGTMGDCGAFTYVNEHEPPYTPDDVVDFYAGADFDFGLSVDHVILGYAVEDDRRHPMFEQWQERQRITFSLARTFLRRSKHWGARFTPIGVAQGWSPRSYAQAVQKLQRMGYDRIALGGMVPLKTSEVLDCLRAVDDVRDNTTRLHLLGLTRPESVRAFRRFGVTSFDSTSPFRQAFMDDLDNYHTTDDTYAALRVPQVDGNARLKARIVAGEVDQRAALAQESTTLRTLRALDRGRASTSRALRELNAYSDLVNGHSNWTDEYQRTLDARPWKKCRCGICDRVGIEVMIFRGAERNKRRGFHNLYVLDRRLRPNAKRKSA